MKLFTIAAALLIAAPAQAASNDYQNCLKLKAELNALQPGLGDKSYDCERVRTWKSPSDRVKAAGGRTALIRKCEAIHKPLLKDPRSYRYDSADVVVKETGFQVNVRYRAKNSFNAYVPGKFTCNFG